MDKLLVPFWEGHEMLRESVLPVFGKDGYSPILPLLYPADEIVSVQSATLETEYEYARDYRLVDGCLAIPGSSRIPVMAYDDYYLAEKDEGRCFEHSESGWIRFSEKDYFHRRQIVVTYRHSAEWSGHIPAPKLGLLPRAASLLREKKPLRLLIFGDSIATGANASGRTGAPPYVRPWYELTASALAEKWSTDNIVLLNTSVGGMSSDWGRDTARENAAALRPDLCVIAFGMNDGSGRRPAKEFIANIQSIMDTVKAENPLCEFVLIATTIANREVKGFLGLQEDYLQPMLALEKTGIAVADMTTVHKDLLARKAFRDMTGNNVNHPNDFLTRVYAQVLLRTLSESVKCGV